MKLLIKSICKFSSPGLGLIHHDDDDRIGISGALLDAWGDDPLLALQLRRLGYRVPIAGVSDTPASRVTLDAIAQDIDVAAPQAAALLSGETDGVKFDHPTLISLLPHIPELPVASVAAIAAPDDFARRPFIHAWLEQQVSTGNLPNGKVRDMVQVSTGCYADLEGRPEDSRLMAAWLGQSRTQPHFSES